MFTNMCTSHQILGISLCLNEVISCISGNVNFNVMLHRCDEVCD